MCRCDPAVSLSQNADPEHDPRRPSDSRREAELGGLGSFASKEFGMFLHNCG